MLTNMFPMDCADPRDKPDGEPPDWRFALLCQCERAGVDFAAELHAELARPCNLTAAARALIAALLATSPAERGDAGALLTCEWLDPTRAAAAAAAAAAGADDRVRSCANGAFMQQQQQQQRPREAARPAADWRREDERESLAADRSRSWLRPVGSHTASDLGSDDALADDLADTCDLGAWRSGQPVQGHQRAEPLPLRRQAPVGAVRELR